MVNTNVFCDSTPRLLQKHTSFDKVPKTHGNKHYWFAGLQSTSWTMYGATRTTYVHACFLKRSRSIRQLQASETKSIPRCWCQGCGRYRRAPNRGASRRAKQPPVSHPKALFALPWKASPAAASLGPSGSSGRVSQADTFRLNISQAYGSAHEKPKQTGFRV